MSSSSRLRPHCTQQGVQLSTSFAFLGYRSGMKIALTGATGHVGANLSRKLLEEGHQVRALVRNERLGLDGVAVEVCAGDLGDRESLERAFQGVEVVYHLAARISI